MLNPIEKFKRSILHLNRSLQHWCRPEGRNWKDPIFIGNTYITRPVIGSNWPRDLKGGKNQAPAYSVSDKGPYNRLESKWYPNKINGKCEVV